MAMFLFLILLLVKVSHVLVITPKWEDYIVKRPGGYILKLQYNSIDSTSGLGKFNFLTKLDLNYNELTSLKEIQFLNLSVLYLMSNKIELIDELKNLIYLTDLDLRYNRIKSIDCIRYLKQMNQLYLTSNQIESIDGMENLKQLTLLDLSFNKISMVDCLENATKLLYLNLRYNQIESVTSLKKLVLLEQLYLNKNQIRSCSGIEMLTSLLELDLSSNRLKYVDGLENLTKLRKFQMSSNQIERIEKSTLIYLTKLRFIDLRRNQISFFGLNPLDKFILIESILLMNNNLSSLLKFTFCNSFKLRYINIENNLIEFIDEFAFFNLSNPDLLITLRNNRIKFISIKAFNQIQNEQYTLILNENSNLNNASLYDFNRLYISYGSLANLKQVDLSIKVLDLSQSRISSLYADTIKGIFFKLILSDNVLDSFETNSFRFLPNLVEINFSKNLIKSLDFENAFEFSLNLLRRLSFKSNRIERVSRGFFTKFPSLNHLDLSNNRFHLLNKDDFFNLFNLECLLLNSNQILTIDDESFVNLTSLIRLDLSANLIYEFKIDIIPKNLNDLSLSQNQIESFSTFTKRLDQLDLSQNRLESISFDDGGCNLKRLILGSNQINYINLSNLNQLEYLDLSFNDLKWVNFSSKNNISHLNLNGYGVGNKTFDLYPFKSVKNLSMSKTSLNFFNLTNEMSQNIETLDLSFSNLSFFATSLNSMKRLNLSAAFLNDYKFLNELNFQNLEEIDLSYNLFGGDDLKYSFLRECANLKKLIIKKANLSSINSFLNNSLGSKLEYLDLSFNNLKVFDYFPAESSIYHLDISHNNLFALSVDSRGIEIKQLLNNFISVHFFFMESSLSSIFSNRIFYFSKIVEYAYLSSNNINEFPRLCAIYPYYHTYSVNSICNLKLFDFSSNNLKQIRFIDLIDLNNLEYLNLNNNSLTQIEANAFSNLLSLETLILSNNNLTVLGHTTSLFDSLANLKFLNLSHNSIRILYTYAFKSLQKLEILDLSFNEICLIQNLTFFKLTNLKSLHLNANSFELEIECDSFRLLDSIQNVFVSKSLLKNSPSISNLFIRLFDDKNRNFNKVTLGRSYFKSLFLTANYWNKEYDCNLTIYFMRKNVHLNFKTEQEIFDYFNECSQLSIKTFLSSLNNGISRVNLIFANVFFLFFWLVLFLIVTLGFYLLKI